MAPRTFAPSGAKSTICPDHHGSAIFTRGETQSLTTLTLGTKDDEQLIDNALVRKTEKFLLHYNFPPFSTGEARPIRGTSRREIGHGNLALACTQAHVPSSRGLSLHHSFGQ